MAKGGISADEFDFGVLSEYLQTNVNTLNQMKPWQEKFSLKFNDLMEETYHLSERIDLKPTRSNPKEFANNPNFVPN
jgi:hypothetical protein